MLPPTLKPVQALDLVEGRLQHPLVVVVHPARGHWDLLRLMIQDAGTECNLTSDARPDALVIEHNCLLRSAACDFRRFAGLRFRIHSVQQRDDPERCGVREPSLRRLGHLEVALDQLHWWGDARSDRGC
jgi:hypothetical protein